MFGVVLLVAGNLCVSRLANALSGASAVFAVATTAAILYGALIGAALWLHRSLQPDVRFADAFGFSWRWSDLPVGLAASLAARIAAVLAVLPFIAWNSDLNGTNVPSSGAVLDDVALLVALSTIAVVVAPLVEELFFRGLLQRSLEVSLPPWLAIATTSAVFGLAHVDPARGWSNVSVVVATGSGGAIFGMVARSFRRLGPAIVAHSLFNAVAIGFIWAVR